MHFIRHRYEPYPSAILIRDISRSGEASRKIAPQKRLPRIQNSGHLQVGQGVLETAFSYADETAPQPGSRKCSVYRKCLVEASAGSPQVGLTSRDESGQSVGIRILRGE